MVPSPREKMVPALQMTGVREDTLPSTTTACCLVLESMKADFDSSLLNSSLTVKPPLGVRRNLIDVDNDKYLNDFDISSVPLNYWRGCYKMPLPPSS